MLSAVHSCRLNALRCDVFTATGLDVLCNECFSVSFSTIILLLLLQIQSKEVEMLHNQTPVFPLDTCLSPKKLQLQTSAPASVRVMVYICMAADAAVGPELELVGISSGSWCHCLPIRTCL